MFIPANRIQLFLFYNPVLVSVHEFINPSCSIYKLHLACIKGMRCIGNLKLDKWIFIAILPFNCVSWREQSTCSGKTAI